MHARSKSASIAELAVPGSASTRHRRAVSSASPGSGTAALVAHRRRKAGDRSRSPSGSPRSDSIRSLRRKRGLTPQDGAASSGSASNLFSPSTLAVIPGWDRPSSGKGERPHNYLLVYNRRQLACFPREDGTREELSRLELTALFQHYDRNHNSIWSEGEAALFADDILDLIPKAYRVELLANDSKVTESNVDVMVQKDLRSILPGNRARVVAILQKEIPVSGPSSRGIRQADFLLRWVRTAPLLFAGIYPPDPRNIAGLNCCAIL